MVDVGLIIIILVVVVFWAVAISFGLKINKKRQYDSSKDKYEFVETEEDQINPSIQTGINLDIDLTESIRNRSKETPPRNNVDWIRKRILQEDVSETGHLYRLEK